MSKTENGLKRLTTDQQLDLLLEEFQIRDDATGDKLSKEQHFVAKIQLAAARMVAEDVLQDCLEVGKIDPEFCKEKVQFYTHTWEENIRSFAAEIMKRALRTPYGNMTIH
ncbi:MAG: hypothetical protein LBH38_00495 [Holosporales bacterium]|jgi:hypothetical protein|nr:hypothetical protein [Holosporales bacterium]